MKIENVSQQQSRTSPYEQQRPFQIFIRCGAVYKMRKFLPFILLLAIIVLFSACHHSKYRNISIRTNENNLSLAIQFAGEVRFTGDSTAIKSISPDGKELVAESDPKGQITLTIYTNGRKITSDDEGKIFLTEAVKDMIAKGVDVWNDRGEQIRQ